MYSKKMIVKLFVFLLIILICTIALKLYQRVNISNFSCYAFLTQSYKDEKINVSVGYTLNGGAGIISMNGYSETKPEKKFNRKIYFKVSKHNEIYHMHSIENIKFPDDNVDDEWLSLHEPSFFIYPNKSIYLKIIPLKNKNFLFMTNSIPSYICMSISYKK